MDSYKESIFEPLEYYRDQAKNAHAESTAEYFESLVKKSGIDEEENRQTVKKYKEKLKLIKSLQKKLTGNKTLRILAIIFAAILLIASFIVVLTASVPPVLVLLPAILIGAGAIFLSFKLTAKRIKSLDRRITDEELIAYSLRKKAEAQMAPLNALFSDNDTFNLIEKTFPAVKFDSQFTFENLEDLKNNYGFNYIADQKSSVIDVVSGKLYKNPFLFERTFNESIGSHIYTGSMMISWVEYERDSNGRTIPRTRTEMLVATVTKPKPIYDVTTLLSYGSQVAPDLSFSRENKHFEDLSEKQIDRKLKKGEKSLKKKAEKALSKGKSFTEMSNTKFDVLFDATNRDNEQQFRLMFTPLAQQEMIDLIRSEDGFGDDFDFFKRRKINVIRSEHSQKWDMSTSAAKYFSYDVDEARKSFNEVNNNYFKSVYFDFAPLIAIPAYQEPPASSMQAPEHDDVSYTEYNYEAIANRIGRDKFAHPLSATEPILKTELIKRKDGFDTVAVTAYSYSTVPRTDFVPTFGQDRRMHTVPVPWLEYLPEQKTTLMTVKNIGLSEREYLTRVSQIEEMLAPQDATCYKGAFAFIGTADRTTNEFIKLLTT